MFSIHFPNLPHIQLIPVYSNPCEAALQDMATMARTIWCEHYSGMIGLEQALYMAETFQSVTAIASQISAGACYFLIEYEQTTVGYTAFEQHDDALFVSKLYLLNTYRGKGIAQAVLHWLEEQARQFGLSFLFLLTNQKNTVALEAYKRFGFSIVSSLVKDVGQGYSVSDYRLEKQVSPL
jgi:GNAT superfamily N-acetyltransferase